MGHSSGCAVLGRSHWRRDVRNFGGGNKIHEARTKGPKRKCNEQEVLNLSSCCLPAPKRQKNMVSAQMFCSANPLACVSPQSGGGDNTWTPNSDALCRGPV